MSARLLALRWQDQKLEALRTHRYWPYWFGQPSPPWAVWIWDSDRPCEARLQ